MDTLSSELGILDRADTEEAPPLLIMFAQICDRSYFKIFMPELVQRTSID